MNMFGPRRAGIGTSMLFPLSGTGLLLVLVLAAELLVVRFTNWLLVNNMTALSSAAIVVLAVLGGAYAARCIVASAETSAEGFDVAQGPSNPAEVEDVFGAAVAFVGLSFFAFAPFGIGVALSIEPPVVDALAVLGGAYLPAGILGIATTGGVAGCFPPAVVKAFLAAPARWLVPAALGAGAVLVALLTREGAIRAPWPLATLIDAGAAWLILAAVHRAGVLHREEAGVKAAMPYPVAPAAPAEAIAPRRPVSDIERLLAERSKK